MKKFCFAKDVKTAFEALAHPLAIYQFIDKHVVTIALSKGFCDLFGYEDQAEAYSEMDNNMYRYTHPEDVARIESAAFRFATEGGTYDVVYRSKTKNNPEYKIIHAIGKHVTTEEGVRLAHVWYLEEGKALPEQPSDSTLLKEALIENIKQSSLKNSGLYDHLTGLPNMMHFFDTAELTKRSIESRGEKAVIVLFDLKGMKFFNSRHGFAAGNALIKDVAGILKDTFGDENCCRIGGDSFSIITKRNGIERVIEGIFSKCQNLNDGNSVHLRTGVCEFDDESVSIGIACDRAKLASEIIRNTYNSQFCFFSSEMSKKLNKQNYIMSNLDRALEEKWIQVYYQPIVRAVTGRVCDEEALARWIDPVKGVIKPDNFIPFLEDSGQIYRLDLYVLDRIIEKIKTLQAEKLYIVPQSLNLSRSDFSSCDIVKEVCDRVDRAGISHNMISIEVTESIMGRDTEFMKSQIKKFKDLGFPVWLDDFGSEYASLDILQSVKFDVIKFDMSFMQRLDDVNGKIILTEMMRMATALGVDTVCEGVETEEQVEFLMEIGCSKLQGYYFLKAIPVEKILERYRTGKMIGFENPEESAYYEKLGRLNLYDLSVIANKEKDEFRNIFSTLPMCIVEVKDGKAWFLRSNRSYREFVKRFFNVTITKESTLVEDINFTHLVNGCLKDGTSAFYKETMPDGTVIHSFARRINENPITGRIALAVMVLTVKNE